MLIVLDILLLTGMKLNFKIFNEMEICYLTTVVLSIYCTFLMSRYSLKFGGCYEEMQLTSVQQFRRWGLMFLAVTLMKFCVDQVPDHPSLPL